MLNSYGAAGQSKHFEIDHVLQAEQGSYRGDQLGSVN